MSTQVKKIAFYLPQFHCIPENDEAYGKGFTEWTNTKKALPLFEGHYQPKIPYKENYYDLLNPQVMREQAMLAKAYGIYGFCYYHYWFKNGKKLLERPLENMLQDASVDIPFCLCWANENWSKRWDGGNQEVIATQDYGDKKDWEVHLQYLVQFFRDRRYIKKNGKPILIIYKPELMPNRREWVSYMRKRMKKLGFPGIEIWVQYPYYILNGFRKSTFDGYIEFEPGFTREEEALEKRGTSKVRVKKILNRLELDKLVKKIEAKGYEKYVTTHTPRLDVRDYDLDWHRIINRRPMNAKMIPGGFVDWDNTARNKNGIVYKNGNPTKFGKYMKLLVEKASKEYKVDYLFINAWNEWAEGAYLEPDQRYGYEYLESIRDI